ncbi:MAG: glucose-6-phosphate isomerase [Rhodothermales bacterium]|nr:glucose-6-phosphate isomerase [Rhodothermales bacterium]
MLTLDTSTLSTFLPDGLAPAHEAALAAQQTLRDGSGRGGDALGWRRMLLAPDRDLMERLVDVSSDIRANADVLVCIGIGGSYLGAQAVLDALNPYFGQRAAPKIVFAGHQMSGRYLDELLASLEGQSVYVNVISKSGTTLEPALAFRALRTWMVETYGPEEARKRIVATTDPKGGALRTLATDEGYTTFEIPPDVGGRFSVLTPVGLIPIGAAGHDIQALFRGAADLCRTYESQPENAAVDYASARYLLDQKGYTTELLAVFEPRLKSIGAWWQQLYGESEGKEHKGLFPVSVQYSTDLHSLGQYVQEGQRNLIETFLMLKDDGGSFQAPAASDNLDGLDYLVGKTFTEINRKAYEGTLGAHVDGGVPAMTLWLDKLNATTLGEAVYFFEHAVGVSGYLLGVNPFDQPGVEAYKQRMFSLLGKPGAN